MQPPCEVFFGRDPLSWRWWLSPFATATILLPSDLLDFVFPYEKMAAISHIKGWAFSNCTLVCILLTLSWATGPMQPDTICSSCIAFPGKAELWEVAFTLC